MLQFLRQNSSDAGFFFLPTLTKSKIKYVSVAQTKRRYHARQREDMLYNGAILEWYGFGKFRATSGLPGHQITSEQAKPDAGPISEGLYSFPLILTRDAIMIGPGKLDHRPGVEHVPDSLLFAGTHWGNNAWGPDRVRLMVIQVDNPRNRHRGRFDLHDPTTGFSHGCIEVKSNFFQKLCAYIGQPPALRGGRTCLYLRVKFLSPSASTDGQTGRR